MSDQYDVIVIGGGHNGLVTGAYLAQAGLNTLVLERRAVLGGAGATEEIFPGFQANTGSADAGLFSDEISNDLRLVDHGLRMLEPPAMATALLSEDRHLTIWRDPLLTAKELKNWSDSDAQAYPHFVEFVDQLKAGLRGFVEDIPPVVPDKATNPSQILPWLQLGLKLRRSGSDQMTSLVRSLPLPMRDFLDEWFESQELKGILATSSTIGSSVGPYQAGTALAFLYQNMGGYGGGFRSFRPVSGGVGELSAALAAAAKSFGAEIRTGAQVIEITLDTDEEKVTGIKLSSGEVIQSQAVVSSANPRHTFFGLVGGAHLPPSVINEVRNIRFQGTTAKVNLALSELPAIFQHIGPEALSGHIILGASLEYIERAADDSKYGRIPENPLLDMVVPTIIDPDLAPEDHHIMAITVKYVPYHLRGGSWDAMSEALGDRVVSTITRLMPDLPGLILHRQVITPLDLEREYGLTEGSIYHGQMGLDQLFILRPFPGYASYRTPFKGLYLGGAGSHPGGGLTGIPGRNASKVILTDRRKA